MRRDTNLKMCRETLQEVTVHGRGWYLKNLGRGKQAVSICYVLHSLRLVPCDDTIYRRKFSSFAAALGSPRNYERVACEMLLSTS